MIDLGAAEDYASFAIRADLMELIGAGLLILLGWAAAVALARLALPLVDRLRIVAEAPAGARTRHHLCQTLRAIAVLLIYFIGVHLRPWSTPPLLLLAIALGCACAMAFYRIERLLMIARPVSLLLSCALFVAVVAGTLGGLQPVLETLDISRFTVGRHSLSALDIVTTALVAAILFVLVRLTIRVVNRSIQRTSSLDPLQRVLIQKLVGIAIVVIAVIFGVDLLGIDLTSLAVFSGALGLAIGFGLQKTFGNLIAGLILLMDRSIKPGDIIAVGDTFGWVNKIGIRAVSVITRDGKEHLIPNENLMTQQVENWSFSSRDVRIHVPVGVSYEADIHLAQKLMLEAAAACPRVLKSPAPVAWLQQFGERSVEYDIRVWISDPEAGVGNVRSEILTRIWDMFRENGIGLPYPQRDIHIRSIPPELVPSELVTRDDNGDSTGL